VGRFPGIKSQTVAKVGWGDVSLSVRQGEDGRADRRERFRQVYPAFHPRPRNETGTPAPSVSRPARTRNAPRLAPLLEVGAGFHPDLTGTQNIFFNGSILGLTRAQMQARLPEIRAFADFDEEIYYDAPVRTYSSGMYVRLGFAVAVHTDPEIILIDETLAVGDEAFQEKCYARIAQFQRERKTIVFVSHDMAAVRRVASRVVWMKKGRIAGDSGADGLIEPVIARYHAYLHDETPENNPCLTA
jgi:ABC-type polysaccharide/polyol phosphate transport system ATPase subunit